MNHFIHILVALFPIALASLTAAVVARRKQNPNVNNKPFYVAIVAVLACGAVVIFLSFHHI